MKPSGPWLFFVGSFFFIINPISLLAVGLATCFTSCRVSFGDVWLSRMLSRISSFVGIKLFRIFPYNLFSPCQVASNVPLFIPEFSNLNPFSFFLVKPS